MAQTSNVYRRGSGIYAVRLVVPERLRSVIGKREIHVSTKTRELPVAKLIASAALAHWRGIFLSLSGVVTNLDRMMAGHPALSSGGHIPLSRASEISGLDAGDILREAAGGRMGVFFRSPGTWGHLLLEDAPSVDLADVGGLSDSEYTCRTGLMRIQDGADVANALIAAGDAQTRLFDRPRFVAEDMVSMTLQTVEVETYAVEALRFAFAGRVTPAQIEVQRAAGAGRQQSTKASRRFSEAIDAFIADKEKSCAPDHASRVRKSCELFRDLEGDLYLHAVDRERLRKFMEKLALVPARKNHLPEEIKDKNILELIDAAPEDWPRLSVGVQKDFMRDLCALFKWALKEKWISDDPSTGLIGLVGPGKAQQKHQKANSSRDIFTDADLHEIFGADWFKTGRGELTSNGTYRAFLPFYYWLPLLALYTGARPNELCQLSLSDVRMASGVWVFDFNENHEERSVKNANSIRVVPVHRRLIELGLIDYRNALEKAGHSRLFPEIKRHEVKGFSKTLTAWFMRFKEKLGWAADNKKVFYSFRHTVTTHCQHDLMLPQYVTASITGHERGEGVMWSHYTKDLRPDVLAEHVNKINFALPEIAAFDVPEGIKAVGDALRRKRA